MVKCDIYRCDVCKEIIEDENDIHKVDKFDVCSDCKRKCGLCSACSEFKEIEFVCGTCDEAFCEDCGNYSYYNANGATDCVACGSKTCEKCVYMPCQNYIDDGAWRGDVTQCICMKCIKGAKRFKELEASC